MFDGLEGKKHQSRCSHYHEFRDLQFQAEMEPKCMTTKCCVFDGLEASSQLTSEGPAAGGEALEY